MERFVAIVPTYWNSFVTKEYKFYWDYSYESWAQSYKSKKECISHTEIHLRVFGGLGLIVFLPRGLR